ncbi:NADPH:quinone oxidoreductase family protein [Paraburkholderia sp. J63]|uniref:NADPH:quinone oxidoreductase family protein n=1 Tax=Paraburkholderia sp. J63 TaxID=2805434 RepID=UPI002ABD15B4|nr:NADPH:quinone oxidoreductase family protein [Paraburkholderia sp. J63]
MRAIRCNQYGPPETLTLEDLPDLVPGAGQVVIDVKAAAVNFPDVLIIENKYQVKPPLPFTPGAEVAGIVRAAGEGVKLAPGTRVVAYVGNGGFAQQALADAAACVPLPEGADFATAAAFTLAYGTSHHAVVDRAALRAGETMLVLGAAGGVGLAAVEIGKVLGARVIAAASSDEKLEVCRRFGADATINYSTEDLRERIKALTDGKGPDVIYDPVGGVYAEPAFRSIGWRGRYLVVGFANGEIPKLPLNLTLLKGASIVGVFWGDFARREPQHNAAAFAQMVGWIGEGKLKPYVSKRYALADVPQALKDMASRKVTGKIVIEP